MVPLVMRNNVLEGDRNNPAPHCPLAGCNFGKVIGAKNYLVLWTVAEEFLVKIAGFAGLLASDRLKQLLVQLRPLVDFAADHQTGLSDVSEGVRVLVGVGLHENSRLGNRGILTK